LIREENSMEKQSGNNGISIPSLRQFALSKIIKQTTSRDLGKLINQFPTIGTMQPKYQNA
jgi:hypothetical protein